MRELLTTAGGRATAGDVLGEMEEQEDRHVIAEEDDRVRFASELMRALGRLSPVRLPAHGVAL